jgi:hypothetical protein
MENEREFTPEVRQLLREGQELSRSITSFLSSLPDYQSVDKLSDENKRVIEKLTEQTRGWFSQIKLQILPYALYSEAGLLELLQDVLGTFQMMVRHGDDWLGATASSARRRAEESINEAISVIGRSPVKM